MSLARCPPFFPCNGNIWLISGLMRITYLVINLIYRPMFESSINMIIRLYFCIFVSAFLYLWKLTLSKDVEVEVPVHHQGWKMQFLCKYGNRVNCIRQKRKCYRCIRPQFLFLILRPPSYIFSILLIPVSSMYIIPVSSECYLCFLKVQDTFSMSKPCFHGWWMQYSSNLCSMITPTTTKS
jgi:hypothetical protein